MANVYTATFGDFPLRFACKDDVLFVSKDDLFAILRDSFVPELREQMENLVEGGLRILGDAKDHSASVLGKSAIGPAIHFHAAGYLLVSLADLVDAEIESLRETAFRIDAFSRWYITTLSSARDYYGITVTDMFNSIINRLERLNPPFEVVVLHEDNIWTAECDALGLVTEADSYEELTERAWEIARELVDLNGHRVAPENIRLSFRQTQDSPSSLAL